MPMNRAQARVVDLPLSTVMLGYRNGQYIGAELFPIVNGVPSGAKVIRFDKKSFVRRNMRRAPGAKTGTLSFGYASDPVALVQDSLDAQVPREWWRDTTNVPNLDLGTTAVQLVMDQMLLSLEHDHADLAQDASNYDANHKASAAVAWTDSSADIRKEINEGKKAIRGTSGAAGNVLEIPYDVFLALQDNNKLNDHFKFTSSDSLTTEMMARYLGLAKVVVGGGVSATDEDSDFTDIWTKAVLAYVPQTLQNMAMPSFGYTYVGEGQPLVEEPYYDKSTKSWLYPTEYERRPYITSMQAGFLLEDVL